MKSLQEYVSEITGQSQENDMKPMKIMAEQSDETEALYNTEMDRWSRNAKHPITLAELEIDCDVTWEKGESAMFESQLVQIKIPSGPNGTVGIAINGKTKMVRAGKLSKIDEAVMGGVQSLNPINRMMQLAGISVPITMSPSVEAVEETATLEEADAGNMFEQLFKANFAGEYKNNPVAARLATVGQVMVGLESQIAELRSQVSPDLLNKLNVVAGLGASMIQTSRAMLQPQQATK